MKNLLEICESENLWENLDLKTGTAKFQVHPYAELYDNVLKKYRNCNVNLLEIGALWGASTIIWDKYFPYGNITVVDIYTDIAVNNIKGRVRKTTKILRANAYTKEFSDTLNNFDIINDDGPHTLDSMLKFIELYFPKLNEGGIMIIEDIPCSSYYKELIKATPTTNIEVHDFVSQAKSPYKGDSRVFIAYK